MTSANVKGGCRWKLKKFHGSHGVEYQVQQQQTYFSAAFNRSLIGLLNGGGGSYNSCHGGSQFVSTRAARGPTTTTPLQSILQYTLHSNTKTLACPLTLTCQLKVVDRWTRQQNVDSETRLLLLLLEECSIKCTYSNRFCNSFIEYIYIVY